MTHGRAGRTGLLSSWWLVLQPAVPPHNTTMCRLLLREPPCPPASPMLRVKAVPGPLRSGSHRRGGSSPSVASSRQGSGCSGCTAAHPPGRMVWSHPACTVVTLLFLAPIKHWRLHCYRAASAAGAWHALQWAAQVTGHALNLLTLVPSSCCRVRTVAPAARTRAHSSALKAV
jgi:hypothetical protein